MKRLSDGDNMGAGIAKTMLRVMLGVLGIALAAIGILSLFFI
jgi:hypothetical protein